MCARVGGQEAAGSALGVLLAELPGRSGLVSASWEHQKSAASSPSAHRCGSCPGQRVSVQERVHSHACCVCAHIHVCPRTQTLVCATHSYLCTHVCISMCGHMCTCALVYAYTLVCMCDMHVFPRAMMHLCGHTIHTHMHTHMCTDTCLRTRCRWETSLVWGVTLCMQVGQRKRVTGPLPDLESVAGREKVFRDR